MNLTDTMIRELRWNDGMKSPNKQSGIIYWKYVRTFRRRIMLAISIMSLTLKAIITDWLQ